MFKFERYGQERPSVLLLCRCRWMRFTGSAVAVNRSADPKSKSDLHARENLDFELLYLLEKQPGLSQREIADRLGISLGKVNYCLRGLAAKGAVKFRNFRGSKRKLRYVYVLTPQGISERMAMTQRFLRRKLREYERLKAQIETLQSELPDCRAEDRDD